MSYFAKIENNIVKQIIVADQSFVNGLDGTWIETFEDKSKRGNFAGIGYIYNQENDCFYQPQPYLSWTLNKQTWSWEPPVEYPNDEKQYIWNETKKTWEEITNGL